jgi:hypothetical protein
MTLPRKPFALALMTTVAAAGLSVWDVNRAGAAIDESWLLNTVQNHEQRISGLEAQVGKNSTDIADLKAAVTPTPQVLPTGTAAPDAPTHPVWTPSATPVPTPAPTPAATPPPKVVSTYYCHVPGQDADLLMYTYADGSTGPSNNVVVPAHQPHYQDCP